MALSNEVKSRPRWGSEELLMLIAVLLIVAGTWAFLIVLDDVRGGNTRNFDEWAVRVVRDPRNAAELIGPPWLAQTAMDITALGGPTVMVLATMAVVGYLVLERRYGAMWLVLIATSGGSALVLILKQVVNRPRPMLVPHLTSGPMASFPSGHSTMAAVVYLTLGTLLARLMRRKRLKLYFVMVAMVLTLLVGVSRVFLGVHYPTDVLGGWTLGLVWAVICWLVARWLQRRGIVATREESMPAT